ncbi:IS3 family transposase, partial [Variovorax sp. tm]|uniref:IS3 family transposase n=1 Tax=Variovorax atrisoli TaxID=3394203 RepID=UPI003A8045AD
FSNSLYRRRVFLSLVMRPPTLRGQHPCRRRLPVQDDFAGRILSDAKFTRSMSRKACSPDNAACEGFFGRLKTELFYPRNWQSTTIEQFIQAVDSYIRWYNEQRIKISLGSLSPIEYRESLGLTA